MPFKNDEHVARTVEQFDAEHMYLLRQNAQKHHEDVMDADDQYHLADMVRSSGRVADDVTEIIDGLDLGNHQGRHIHHLKEEGGGLFDNLGNAFNQFSQIDFEDPVSGWENNEGHGGAQPGCF
jgi:hypothetical protein